MWRHHSFRSGSLRPENLQNALAMITSLCFSVFVTAVLIVTIIAATYNSDDPFFHPSSKLTDFLSNLTFKSDQTALINTSAVLSGCCVDEPINCGDIEVFQLLMSAAIDKLKDVDFYRFGKPVGGDNDSCCHMGWRFRPKEGKATGLNKDYRSFRVVRFENCTLSVVGIGEYHSGGNARKVPSTSMDIQETVSGDALLDEPFSGGKYLIYVGGGERCKNMGHYWWSFMCMLGEAEYLNRTLVLDMSICLVSWSGVEEEGKDFRFYFDLEHLKDTSSVVDQAHFWSEWNKRDGYGLDIHLVEGSSVTPMMLAEVKESLIMRKFGELDKYWYRVCQGEADAVIQRPWLKLRNSRQLWGVASAVASRMRWDYDAVRVERGEKAKNKEAWPNLDNDTSPESVMAALRGRDVEDGRTVYIATDEADTSFFDPLKERYSIHFLDEHRDLWDADSDWYLETRKLNNGSALEFDGYMRQIVNDDVFKRGKKRIETFNDLTKDCRDGQEWQENQRVALKCKISVMTNNTMKLKAYSASSSSSSSPLGLSKSKRHNCLFSPTRHRNSKLSDCITSTHTTSILLLALFLYIHLSLSLSLSGVQKASPVSVTT